MAQRVWQAIAVMLAVVLVGLGVATAYVFVTRTSGQSPRPSTTLPASSPSPGASGSALPSGSTVPSASPSQFPTASTSEAPTRSEEPTPSEEPSPTPTGPATGPITTVAFTVDNLGLDDPVRHGALSRYLTFTTDGPGDVKASIAGTTGGVIRLCLWKGTPTQVRVAPLCFVGRGGGLRAVAVGNGRAQWTVRLTSQTAGSTPVTDVSVSYRTRTPRVDLKDFRLQGAGNLPKNGFRVRFKARAAGDAAISASWTLSDEAVPYDYRFRLRDVDSGMDIVNETGNGSDVTAGGAVDAGTNYQLELRNERDATGVESVLDATVSWP